MSNMIELRKAIQASLKAVCPNVYYQDASKEATFPYLVFSLPTSYTNHDQEIFSLDVDIWDQGDDSYSVDMLSDSVDNLMNRLKYTNDYLICRVYLNARLALTDPDPTLQRRQLRYEVITYFR